MRPAPDQAPGQASGGRGRGGARHSGAPLLPLARLGPTGAAGDPAPFQAQSGQSNTRTHTQAWKHTHAHTNVRKHPHTHKHMISLLSVTFRLEPTSRSYIAVPLGSFFPRTKTGQNWTKHRAKTGLILE